MTAASGRRLELEPVIGRTLSGVYRVSELVAGGGFADFYLGRDLRTKTIVGVKVLHPHLAQRPNAVSQFFREARAVQALASPHVVRVLDAGEDEGTHFIVMEYVEGHTLAELLADGRKLAPDDAARLARQILAGLEEAHRVGIVHRDIKPQNVIVAPDGAVKIADFGISQLADEPATDSSGALAGTARYISPEQARGSPADARSDLYSVATVLFEMLAGRPPFTAAESPRLLELHANEPAPRLNQFRDDLPVGLVEAVARGLEKSPDRRYQTAAEFREALGFWEDATRTIRPRRTTDAVAPLSDEPRRDETIAFERSPDRQSDQPPSRQFDRPTEVAPHRQPPPAAPVRPVARGRRGPRPPVEPRPPRRRLPSLARMVWVAFLVAVGLAAVGGVGLVATDGSVREYLAGEIAVAIAAPRAAVGTAVGEQFARATAARIAADEAAAESATGTAQADSRDATAQARARRTATALAEEDELSGDAASAPPVPPATPTTEPSQAQSTTAPGALGPTRTAAPTTPASIASATPGSSRTPTFTPVPSVAPRPTVSPAASGTPSPSPSVSPSPGTTATASSIPTPTSVPTPTPTATPPTTPMAHSRYVVREYPERTASDPAEVCEIRQWSDGTYERVRCLRDGVPITPSAVSGRGVIREYPERSADNPVEICIVRQWSDGSYEKSDCRLDPAVVDGGSPTPRAVIREYPERTAGNPDEVCRIRQWSDGSYERFDCQQDPTLRARSD